MYKLINNIENWEFAYQESDCELDPRVIDKPSTVYQALLVEKYQFPDRWEEIAKIWAFEVEKWNDDDVWKILVKMATETNTCTNCDSPIEVWIDPEGKYRVAVYDDVVSG